MQSLDSLLIDEKQAISEALQVIDSNARGICFVTKNGKLVGVVTDGDIRRSLLRKSSLEQPVSEVMNRNFVALPITSDDKLIRQSFCKNFPNKRLKLIPLLDEQGLVVDVADVMKSHRIPVMEPDLSGNELEYVQNCVTSNWISSQGSYVRQFEEMFEEMHPGMNALAVSNGTVALHLSLVALGIGEGDEVIVPDVTFASTINAVLHCNAIPVLCEIDEFTWCLDAREAEILITPRTKALLPVHLYGQVCQMEELRSLAQSATLLLIEDCAEAIGSQWRNQPVGSFGDAATFSFFGNKTISTGEGGMVLFRQHEVAQRARILRDHGMTPNKRYWHELVGFNYRLTNLQAAIGVAQMERFPAILQKKREIFAHYQDRLQHVPGIAQLPKELDNSLHSHWLYTIRLDKHLNRDEVMRQLLQQGLDTRPVFYPLHQMPPYQKFSKSESLYHSMNIARNGLSLPSSLNLKIEEIEYVTHILTETLKKLHV